MTRELGQFVQKQHAVVGHPNFARPGPRAAADQGWLDYDTVMMEMLLGFKRAGADGVLTYAALDAARLLARG